MIRHEKNGVVYYTFEIFDRLGGVKHAFSTKFGGVSKGCFESMNLSPFRGDNIDDVKGNYERFSQAVGFDKNNVVLSNQIHGTKIVDVTNENSGNGLFFENQLGDCDGLVTNFKGLALTTLYADCVPILFYEPNEKVVASVHSGWRGTLNEIAALAVNKMVKVYGCKAENIYAGIAPSICSECYEVSEDIYQKFSEKLAYSTKYFRKSEKDDTKFYLDLQGLIFNTLTNSGMRAENIELSGLCTLCESDIFFSHRKTGEKRGGLAAVIALE